MAKKILLGLTTITPRGEWKNKIKEIDGLNIKEIALFPTCLNLAERQELYELLEKTKLKRMPHVHVRNDMEILELDYLVKRFKTEVFNVHSEKSSYPHTTDCKKYLDRIYVENMEAKAPTENDLKKYAGLCIDLSHWESGVLLYGENNQENLKLINLAKKHKIGVNHVSAIKLKPFAHHNESNNKGFNHHDSHWLDDLSEVDYVKKYKNYLADIISLELENSLKQQFEVKKYLEEILDL